jgi:hypothetical protein
MWVVVWLPGWMMVYVVDEGAKVKLSLAVTCLEKLVVA